MQRLLLILSLMFLIIGCHPVREYDNEELGDIKIRLLDQGVQIRELYEKMESIEELNEKVKILSERIETLEGYDSNKNEVAFPDNNPYNNKSEFASKGQGRGIIPPYYIAGFNGKEGSIARKYEEMITILGEPLRTSSRATDDSRRQIVSWEYEDLIFLFEESKGEFSDGYYEGTDLEMILSTDKGEYMFGIKHGMHIDELKEIFGDMDFRYYSERQEINLPGVRVENFGDVYTTIKFETDRIKSISWDFSDK